VGSVAGAEYEAVVFTKEARALEKYVEASGLQWTFLRMGFFVENLLGSQAAFKQGVYPQPIAKGSFVPINVSDIGVAAATVLVNPTAHAGKAYLLTGSDSLSADQQATVLSKVLGTEIKHVNPGADNFRKALNGHFAPYQIEGLLELYAFFETNGASTPSPDFEKITGRKPTSYEQSLVNLKTWGLLKL